MFLLGHFASKVSYIMDVKAPLLEPYYKVTKAREIMRVTGARALPVVSNVFEKKLLGVVSRPELLSVSSTRSNLRVSEIMSEPLLVLNEDAEITEAGRAMIERDEWYVPVVRERELLQGMLGLENIIMWLLSVRGDKVRKIPVSEIMSRDVLHVSPDDPVSKVWYLMLKHKYAGLPVVNEHMRPIGVISQYDLLIKGKARLKLESEGMPTKTKVSEVMSKPPITVSPGEDIVKAAEIMVKRNIGRLIVVDDKSRLIGIIDRSDVLRGMMR